MHTIKLRLFLRPSVWPCPPLLALVQKAYLPLRALCERNRYRGLRHGNLHSIHAGLCRTGTRMPITLSDKAADIAAAEKVVLPGDGHFDSCMKEIRRRGLCDELIRATREKPFLGICVGMQALYESSEEGAEKGLGVLAGSVLGLPPTANKIPHMGWNETRRRKTHAILDNIPDDTRFYFIHSYYVPSR